MHPRFLRAAGAVAALFLCVTAFGDKFELKFTFAGKDAGQEVVETKPDGSFVSKGLLDVGALAIESRLTGKIVKGELVEFELNEKAGPTEYSMTTKDGKVVVVVQGKTQEVPFKPPKAFFANAHPWLSGSFRTLYDFKKGGAQDVSIYVIDGATSLKVNVNLKKTRVLQVAGQKKVVQVFHVRFPTMVEMDISAVEGGPTVAWDVPAQMIKATAPGFEALNVDPTLAYKELSQPTYRSTADKGVKVPMRDGVNLVTDVVRPNADGRYPAILIRTPYGRASNALEGDWWAQRGYVLVSQDVRGRFDSEGDFDPMASEKKDGYDTLDWIAKQPWSNGKVGMIGGSYLGFVQWAAAVTGHPALKCIVPQVSPPDMFFNIPYDHGIFFLYGAAWWANVVKDRTSIEVALGGFEGAKKLTTLPLSKVDDEIFGKSISFYDGWLKKTKWSDFSDSNFLEGMKNVKIPALHISGWWDGDGIGTKMNWERMRSLGRKNQWVIYGPWTHFFNGSTKLGDVDYGPDAVLELQSLYLRWFDTWLKGKNVGLNKVPKARIFVTGANNWREYSDWPAPNAKRATFYLSGTGKANGKTSKGVLTLAKPPKTSKPDKYDYDPSRAKISGKEGDISQATTKISVGEFSSDVLVYKTAPLTKPMEIGGPIQIDLHFATSAVDTDFFATIVDIDEKGQMRLIGQPGKMRAMYLSGWNNPKLLTPGKTYKITLDHWDTAHRFAKGHRMGLLIGSEMFPTYARNLNTGEPYETGTKMVTARQTVFHDAARPSAVHLYLLPGKG